jgi:biotin carboxyl carrier protein
MKSRRSVVTSLQLINIITGIGRMNFIKRIYPAAIFLFVILIMIYCKGSEEKESAAELKGIEVVAGNPVKKKMIDYIDLNANTTYLKQENVRVTFQGFVEKVFKNIGDQVKQGDLLFTIKTKEADAVENSSNQQFTGLVKILARTDGVMTELSHQAGDFVSDGELLALIVNPQSLRVILDVPFQFAKSIIDNYSYIIQLPDGRELDAKVAKRIPSIDPANQTQKFILELVSKIDIPANLNVNVKIPLKIFDDAIALPKSSIMTNETQTDFWVMKIINDSLAVKLNITKGLESDGFVQIKEPKINLSERFIIEGAFGLPDTANISIQSIQKNIK